MDSDVGLDGGFILADEVGKILDFDLRFDAVATVGLAAGVAGSANGCNDFYLFFYF